jgi:hypothetical protein
MQDRAESKGAQGQWYDDADIVLAEQVAPKHPGKYLMDFKRSIGRVFVKGQGKDNPVEGVTRFYIQRKPDGTLETTYPVSKNFTLQ